MLINRIYHADPLRCARCGGSMKIIAFIEADQGDVICKILEHCDLWHDPPPRAPPFGCGASQPVPPASTCGPDCGITYEADPQFLEHACPRAARPTATALVGMRKACEASGLKQPAAFVNFALDAAKSRHMVRYRAPGA